MPFLLLGKTRFKDDFTLPGSFAGGGESFLLSYKQAIILFREMLSILKN